MPVLDLTDREDVSFDALPPGRYLCEVFEVDERETDNPDGKLPVGTKYANIQWRCIETDERHDPSTGKPVKVENRRFFSKLFFPPEGHDPVKAKRMNGMIYRFLLAVGYDEETINSGSFELDYDDLLQRKALVTVNKREYPADSGDFQNDVKGVKPLSEAQAETASIL